MKAKMKNAFYLMLFVTFLPCVSVYADHDSDAMNEVAQESIRLNQQVQYSYLNYRVKRSVQNFMYAIRYLSSCESRRFSRLNTINTNNTDLEKINNGNNNTIMDHAEIECELEHQRAQSSWSTVERYLYDTNYDFPSIYQQYLRTRTSYLEVSRGDL